METITFEEGKIYARALQFASKLMKRNLDPADIADEVLTEFGGSGPDTEYAYDVMAMLVPVTYNYRICYYAAAEQKKSLIDGKDDMYLGRSLEWYEQERQYFLHKLLDLDIFEAASQFKQKARELRRVMEIMAYSHFVGEAVRKSLCMAVAKRMLADGIEVERVASYLNMKISDVRQIGSQSDRK